MKCALKTAIAGLILALSLVGGPATAGPFEDGKAAYDRGDYATALLLVRSLAEQGNAGAQFKLGNMYHHGEGVARDFATALSWYRKAADQGEVEAQLQLGTMYYLGYDVPQNYAAAVRWYRTAADQGDSRAQCSLGDMYRYGQGVPRDYAAALNWYRKAADQGNAEAQISLGGMYEEGSGVSQDYAAAVSWYRKAAELGYREAQWALGMSYYLGGGTAQDYVLAHTWFNLAAARGHALGGNFRDRVAVAMTPAQIAEAQRLAREWKPKLTPRWMMFASCVRHRPQPNGLPTRIDMRAQRAKLGPLAQSRSEKERSHLRLCLSGQSRSQPRQRTPEKRQSSSLSSTEHCPIE